MFIEYTYLTKFILLTILFFIQIHTSQSSNKGGPSFITVQSSPIEFLNTEEVRLGCLANGDPDPEIRWYKSSRDGQTREITDIPFIRRVYANGSLVMFSFRREQYLQEVHDSVYQCLASNVHGIIISSPVHVRAVTAQNQQPQAQVHDEYVIRGNTAVFKCHIPTFFKDDLRVTSWLREDNYVIKPNAIKDRHYSITQRGNLHIRHVTESDENLQKGYWCQVTNRITKHTFLSQTAGRVKLTDPQGAVQPTISDIMKTVRVEKGKPVKLHCAGQGYPPPVYNWKTPDGSVITNTNGLLPVSDTNFVGTFEYCCILRNSNGEDSKTTFLVVTEKLGVYVTQEKTNGGRDITIQCHPSGYPIAEIHWYINGRKLIPSEKHEVSNHSKTIVIKNAGIEDRGMYQCFASNKEEIVQAALQLTLGDYFPTFVKTFQKKLLQPGPSVELECSGIGQPTPTIRWIRNGMQVVDDERTKVTENTGSDSTVTSKFILKNIRVEDGGEYKCLMMNSIGRKIYVNKVEIYGLPFVHDLKNVTVTDGQHIYIHCYVSGHPIKNIHWEKVGKSSYLPRHSKAYENGTLILFNVTDGKDDGLYKCVATNGRGQYDSKSVYVNIAVKPEIAPPSLTYVNLSEEKPFSSFCSVINGDEPIKIIWLQNNRPIVFGLGTDIATTKMYSVLQIRNVKEIHNGNYTCVAQNSAGITSKTTILSVQVSPSWKKEPRNITLSSGRTATFYCAATGTPNPTVEWMRIVGRKFKELNSSNRYNINGNGSLIIHQAQSKDSGRYSCVISNGIIPDLVKEVFLLVEDVPQVKILHRGNKLMVINRGQEVEIMCRVKGTGNLSAAWQKNGKQLPKDDRRITITKNIGRLSPVVEMKLIISNFSRQDSGSYKCIGRNDNGERSKEVLTDIKDNSPSTDIPTLAYFNIAEESATKTVQNKKYSHEDLRVQDVSKKQQDASAEIVSFNTSIENQKHAESNKEFTSGGNGDDESFTLNIPGENFGGILLFTVPAAVLIILLIAVVVTLTVYLLARNKNKTKRNLTVSNDNYEQESCRFAGDKRMKQEIAENSTIERRYGKLYQLNNRNRDSQFSNAYEIPDYCSGIKPYATLQLSSRRQQNLSTMNRDSQASV